MIVLGEYATSYYNLDFYEDETATTIYAIGSPNQGKSTLLGNLAEQFCAAGEGVLVLDIKGDMVQEIARRTRNSDRTVYVKLGEIPVPGMDTRFWTFNPFEGHRESLNRMNHIRTSVLESFERMGMAQLDTMANIRNTLQHAIELSLTLPDPTYVDLYAIVASQGYRKALLGRGNRLPPLNQKFWQDLDNKEVTTSFQRRQQINTTRNRMEWMLSTPNFNIPAGTYQSTLLLRQWLNEGKMVLVDLGLPLDQYTAINLGNMITAQLMTEIFTRENRDRRWRIVVDEFHNFVGDPFAEIITAARSYNVFCVLAHQDRGQLAGDRLANVRSAIGHAGITVRMRGSRQDRMDLIGLYGHELIDEFYSLKSHTALVSYTHSPPDNEKTELILLNDWTCPVVPGQLDVLRTDALAHTLPRKALVDHNWQRYWDRLGIEPIRDSGDSNGNAQPKRQNRKGTTKPEVRSKPDETTEAGGTGDEEAQRPPRPGSRRSPRIVDELDDSGSLLPRPPAKD